MDDSTRTKTVAAKASGAAATAKDAVTNASATAKDAVANASATTKDAVANASANARESTQAAAVETKGFLERNPLGLAIGSIAVGFLVGLAVPMSDLEREKVAPFGDKLSEQARGAADGFVTQGKTAVLDAVTTALKPSGK